MYQVEAVVRASFSSKLINELRALVPDDTELMASTVFIDNVPGSPFYKKASPASDYAKAEWNLACEKISLHLSGEDKKKVMDKLKSHPDSVINITSTELEAVIDISSGKTHGLFQKKSDLEFCSK